MTSQNFVKNIKKNADGSIANIENVGGIIFKTVNILLANASVSTDWISYDQYASASTIIYSDTISATSGLKYEYSADGGTTILDTVSVSFVTLNDFKVAIFPLGKGTHLRVSYTNGAISQTKFYLSISLSLDMVNSMGSVFTPINVNNIASITKTFLQVPDTNTTSGLYDFITRTGNSLNVNVTSTGNSLEVTQLLVKAKTDNLDVPLSTRLKPSDTLSAVTNVGSVTSITNALPTGSNTIGNVTSNSTLLNGVTFSVNNGSVSAGTQRVILANRIETILGGIETFSDISAGNSQRIKILTFTNNSANIIFLQIYNKSTSLITGDIPMNGLIFRVPANSTLDKTVADFGEAGILYGTNTRIGLSSTFGTYTAITPTNTSINIITVA